MNSLDSFHELMTIREVAAYLRVKPGSVYGIKGLRKVRIGEGRGFIRVFKKDFISFINSFEEVGGGNGDVRFKEERKRKVGLPSLLSWKELEKIHV